MEINSHVQMPKGIMKAFSHRTFDGKCVYYLDLKDMEIKEGKIGKLGTIEGLYGPTGEAILNHIYETPFFQSIQRIKAFSKGELATLTLTQKDETALVNFIKMSLMRSKKTIETAKQTSFTARIFPSAFQQLYVPVTHETLSNLEIFTDYRFNCLVNRSNLRLVAPRNCIVFCSENNVGFCILPVSPNAAILYEPKELFERSIDSEGNLWYSAIEQGEEEMIRRINRKAATTEQHFNNEFLIGFGREELEILKGDLLERANERVER